MISFSPSEQVFYDSSLNYQQYPDDLVEIDHEQHMLILGKINTGHYIFPDFSFSEKSPSAAHKFIDGKWIDNRTAAQKRKAYLATLKPLSRRQFKLALLKNKLLNSLELAISEISDPELRSQYEIEYHELTVFERTNESVIQLLKLVNLNSKEIDLLWENAQL